MIEPKHESNNNVHTNDMLIVDEKIVNANDQVSYKKYARGKLMGCVNTSYRVASQNAMSSLILKLRRPTPPK